MQGKNKELIHVIDDNSFIREFLSELIENSGYLVQTFPDAKEYIEHISSPDSKKPLVALVDVIMPSMNGYEMISLIQAKNTGMKFVMMSGELDIRSDYKNLACMYLRKPFYPNCVEKVLKNLSRCSTCGASSEHGCASVDHRGFYELKNWSCPDVIEIKLEAPFECTTF